MRKPSTSDLSTAARSVQEIAIEQPRTLGVFLEITGTTVVEEETDTPICSVCARPTGFGDEDRGEPPVNLARCPAPGGTECRAVAQAVAPWRRELAFPGDES